jgi:PAS domain S-box-containing protein
MKMLQQIPAGEILDLLGNSLDAQVAYVGADLHYRFANDAYHAWFAKPALTLRGKNMQEVLGKDGFDLMRPYIDQALAGEPSEFDVLRRHGSAGVRSIVGRIVPDLQPDGTVNGFIEILRDVTEGKKRQQQDEIRREERRRIAGAMAASEKRFRTMIEQSPLSIQIFSPEGRCIHTNPAWQRLWGPGSDEAQLQHYNILSDPQLEELGLQRTVESAFRGEQTETPPYEYDPVLSGLGGRKRWVRGFFYPIRTEEDLQETVLVLQDVTDEKLSQEELQSAKERFQLIINTALDAVVTIQSDGTITSWDGRAAQIFGWTRDEILGQKLQDTVLPPEQAPRFFKAKAGQMLNRRVELEAVDKSGRMFPVEAAISLAKQGTETFLSTFIRDISGRKEAEQELQRLNARLEERVTERTQELIQANRELEAFSYSVAHDLRSPLRRLAAISSIFEEDYSEKIDKAGHKQLEEMRSFVKDMTQLIEDHLHFARFSRTELHVEKLDFSALAWSVVREVQAQYPALQVKVRVLPTLRVKADPQLLHVILENLLDNAAKFTQDSPTPLVEVGTALDGNSRLFYVRDNGVGFDPKFTEKLFQPFQRLHRDNQYAGTGVGLANVKRLVERHGGRIWAESAEGKGASFYFTLS